MTSVIVVFPRTEDAGRVKNLLQRSGIDVYAVCTNGGAALQAADRLGEGIVVCGYSLKDMLYRHLYELLPQGFQMLLLTSGRGLEEEESGEISVLRMPLSTPELTDQIERMISQYRPAKQIRVEKRSRSESQAKIIAEAKQRLMQRRSMSEPEAHRYLQKISMDSGTNLVETAEMILSLM